MVFVMFLMKHLAKRTVSLMSPNPEPRADTRGGVGEHPREHRAAVST